MMMSLASPISHCFKGIFMCLTSTQVTNMFMLRSINFQKSGKNPKLTYTYIYTLLVVCLIPLHIITFSYFGRIRVFKAPRTLFFKFTSRGQVFPDTILFLNFSATGADDYMYLYYISSIPLFFSINLLKLKSNFWVWNASLISCIRESSL